MIFGKPLNEAIDKHINKIKEHKKIVTNLINFVIMELHNRKNTHDDSSLDPEEAEIMAHYPKFIKDDSYINGENQAYINTIKGALDIHFQKNRHHPEYFKNGIKDMNLIDIIEMLCDWKAMTPDNEDIISVIKQYKKIYNFSDDLMNILINTVNSEIFDK